MTPSTTLATAPTPASPGAPAQPLSSNPKTAAVEPASFAQLAARVIIAVALSMIVFAIWEARLSSVLQWTSREWRVLPSLSIYMLAALMALCIQSAVPKARWVLAGGVLAFVASIVLMNLRGDTPARPVGAVVEVQSKSGAHESDKDSGDAVRSVLSTPATIFSYLGYAAALFTAVLAGTWLGRGLQQPRQYLMFLLCAVSGNAWIAATGLTRTADAGVLSLLRVPWPLGFPTNFCPTLLELLVLCAMLEGARILRLHLF